jgi:hypothetical protein
MNLSETNQQSGQVVAEIPARKAVAASKKESTPMALISMAVQQGADIEYLKQLMDLQERHDANEARKAYYAAFAAFKSEAITILRGKEVTDGPLKGKSYAELYSIIDAVAPAMSKHGLSHSWRLTKDEPAWIEVTCTVKHELGHSESVSMGGPPDAGGAKNAIQARASTVTYLEKYTLKAICGVSERNDDTDANTGTREELSDKAANWIAYITEVDNLNDLQKRYAEAFRDLQAAKDGFGTNQLNKAKDAKKKELSK